MIELAFEGHIELDKSYSRMIPHGERCIIINNKQNPENHILCEILSIMKSCNESITLSDWLLYLSGESWNPLKLSLQVRRVRDRLAKTLSEKGVLEPKQQDYILFNLTTYPLLNNNIKMALKNRIKDILINKWNQQLFLKDIRSYSLVILAYTASVIENILFTLSNEEYSQAAETMIKIASLDLSDTINNLSAQLHKSNSTNLDNSMNLKQFEFVLAVLQVLCNQL